MYLNVILMFLVTKLNSILSNSFLHSSHQEGSLLIDERHGLVEGDLHIHTNVSNCCLVLGKSPKLSESHFPHVLQEKIMITK